MANQSEEDSARRRNPSVEKIRFDGVSILLDKYWYGELAVYFCNYCQTTPTVGPGQIAISVSHDECRTKATKKALEFFETLHDEAARKYAKRANDILAMNPNADVFGEESSE